MLKVKKVIVEKEESEKKKRFRREWENKDFSHAMNKAIVLCNDVPSKDTIESIMARHRYNLVEFLFEENHLHAKFINIDSKNYHTYNLTLGANQ